MADSVYNDLLGSMELDTIVGRGHTSMMPLSLNLSGEYDIRGDKRHIVSLDISGSFTLRQPLYYALTAGYRYTTDNGRFSAIATVSHKRVTPMAIGAGVMANTRNFQFFILGDTDIRAFSGKIGNISGVSLRMGVNFFFNKDRYLKRINYNGLANYSHHDDKY